jgi:peptide/nickel transport system ATP-binding protein
VTAASVGRPVSRFDPDDVMLDVVGLSVDYGAGPEAVRAVDDLDLKLRRGEVLGIVGESGSGKSTLAFAISRLLRPPGQVVAGEVTYHPPGGAPVPLLDLSDKQLREYRWSDIAVVFQSAMNTLNPVLRLSAQFADTLQAHRPGITPNEIAERTAELLQLVGITPDRATSYAHELSGGMRQRAMIALALALDPEIIVMDEPTTALDVVLQRQILIEIMQLQDRLGFSVIFITHDLSLLIELADTIMVMYAGRLVEVADAASIHRAARHPYSRGLLRSFPTLDGPRQRLIGIPGSPPDLRALPTGCPFHPRCPNRTDHCADTPLVLTPTGLAEDGPQHRVACILYDGSPLDLPPVLLSPAGDHEVSEPPPAAADRAPILEARAVSKTFGHVRAVDNVSISLYPGSVTALVGESGSGKSTMARLLAQLYPPTDGDILLEGNRVRAGYGRRFRRYVKDVQLILQDPFASLNPLHTIEYHLARPLRVHGFARSRSAVRAGVDQLLEEVSLTPPRQFAEKFPHELSGGQRQRVAVARALAAQPSVLLADEPVSMLDVSIRLSLLNLFERLVSGRDIALLYITHDIASARQFAETVVVMYAGQVVERGPAEKVVRSPSHPYTRLLIESSPEPNRRLRDGSALERGEPPSMLAPPSGCRFHARCPHAMDICRTTAPPETTVGDGHVANCWLHHPGPWSEVPVPLATSREPSTLKSPKETSE